jgi:hypothetical protein
MKGSSQRNMCLVPLSLVLKNNQSIRITIHNSLSCTFLSTRQTREQKQEGLTLHRIHRVPARPPLDAIIVFTSEALVDGGHFCGPPWPASHRTSSPPTAFFAVVDAGVSTAAHATPSVPHVVSSMAAPPAASAPALPAHASLPSAAGPWPVQGAARGGGTPAGGRAAGHRSGGRARRPRWRLWRLLARRPPATHASDGEGGGGAPESCGGAPKGRCGQRRGRERRCRAGRSASAAAAPAATPAALAIDVSGA